MKRPVSLLVFSLIGIAIDLYSGYLIFPAFAMFTQYHLAVLLGDNYYYVFYGMLLLFSVFILFMIGSLLGLKRWGHNIFIAVTLIMGLLLAFCLLSLPGISILIIIFLICFMIYFLKPSTKALFGK
jgi:hypothetical protein